MSGLPAEAVQAARDEARTWCTDLAADTGTGPSLLRQMITMPDGMIDSAVEAAAPHLVAAERERCGLCTSCPSHYQDGFVEHEDGCPSLQPGHDCQAGASGFCGHPEHAP